MQNYSDLEDKYSFGLLLKSTREYYGINQSKLAKGIISVSRDRPLNLAINAINLCCSEACVKADYKDKKYIDQMEKIIAFCDLIKKKSLKEAIEKCLIMAKNGDDWT